MEPPSLPYLSITFNPFTSGHLVSLLLLIGLLFCSAMISGAEAAYFSLSPNDIHKLKKEDSPKSARILKLLQNIDYLLVTVLFCNNFVNVSIVLLANNLATSLIDFSQVPVLGFIFQVVIITFLLLLFGEIMPKLLAMRHRVGFATAMSQPLLLLIKLTRPIGRLLVSSASQLNKRFNANRKSDVSMDDLADAIDITTTPSNDEKRLLKAIVDSTNTEVKEVMTPRIDITAVNINTSFDKLCQIVVDCAYSRIPIYDNNLDDVKGILYVKDLIPFINSDINFNWQPLIRESYFIPEGKKINDLLEEFQQKKMHMAVVVDEYGGTSGIITLEDILEEIVGEILDESDLEEDESLYVKIDSTTYIFEGKTPLNDFCRIMRISTEFFDKDKGDAETIAGFMLERKGDFIQKDEIVEYRQFAFSIEEADHRRIQKVKVTLTNETSK